MEQKTLLSDYLWLFLVWTGYYVLHSLLASDRVKVLLKSLLSDLYRLFYTIFAMVALLLVLYFQFKMADAPRFNSPALVLLGLCLIGTGVAVMLVAFRNYDVWEFAGIRQVKNTVLETTRNQTLVTHGLQSWVRHPLYLGVLLCCWGYWLARPSVTNLVFAGVTTLYIPIGAHLEEKKLLRQFGKEYANYCAKVPMLFPKLRLK